MQISFCRFLGLFSSILVCFLIVGSNYTHAEASITHDKIAGTITVIGNDGKKIVIEDKNVGADRARDGESLVSEETRGLLYNWGTNEGYSYDEDLPKYDHKTVAGWGGMEDKSDPYFGKELSIEEHLKRQGPCQEGWHVPSIGEWISVMKAWCDYDKECSDSDYSYFYGEKMPYITKKDGYGERFAKDLLLPRIGSRTQSFTDEREYNSVGHYWSSSQYNKGGPNFYLYSFRDDVISHAGNGGYHAMPIRCFENKKDELYEAYKWAYQNGITKQPTMKQANLGGPLTRIAMAKMLSLYAINILGKTPDTSKGEKSFGDVTAKINQDYDNAVTLAYQLGLMGQGTVNFRPYDEVTRAEFATALSRLLYGTSDGIPFFVTHINKLKQEGILTNTNPDIKEKRGYVMVMLMRSVDHYELMNKGI